MELHFLPLYVVSQRPQDYFNRTLRKPKKTSDYAQPYENWF